MVKILTDFGLIDVETMDKEKVLKKNCRYIFTEYGLNVYEVTSSGKYEYIGFYED